MAAISRIRRPWLGPSGSRGSLSSFEAGCWVSCLFVFVSVFVIVIVIVLLYLSLYSDLASAVARSEALSPRGRLSEAGGASQSAVRNNTNPSLRLFHLSVFEPRWITFLSAHKICCVSNFREQWWSSGRMTSRVKQRHNAEVSAVSRSETKGSAHAQRPFYFGNNWSAVTLRKRGWPVRWCSEQWYQLKDWWTRQKSI